MLSDAFINDRASAILRLCLEILEAREIAYQRGEPLPPSLDAGVDRLSDRLDNIVWAVDHPSGGEARALSPGAVVDTHQLAPHPRWLSERRPTLAQAVHGALDAARQLSDNIHLARNTRLISPMGALRGALLHYVVAHDDLMARVARGEPTIERSPIRGGLDDPTPPPPGAPAPRQPPPSGASTPRQPIRPGDDDRPPRARHQQPADREARRARRLQEERASAHSRQPHTPEAPGR